MVVKTTSARQTQDFGREFAKRLSPGSVVCLYGDLGAGKTTLVQGIAKGLGIKKRLISPTFIIVRQYGSLFHIDLYRVDNPKTLGLEELWEDPTSILLIEWPEKIEKILPKPRWNIKLEAIGENKRTIIYEALH